MPSHYLSVWKAKKWGKLETPLVEKVAYPYQKPEMNFWMSATSPRSKNIP